MPLVSVSPPPHVSPEIPPQAANHGNFTALLGSEPSVASDSELLKTAAPIGLAAGEEQAPDSASGRLLVRVKVGEGG